MTTLWTQSNRSQRIFSLLLLLFSLFSPFPSLCGRDLKELNSLLLSQCSWNPHRVQSESIRSPPLSGLKWAGLIPMKSRVSTSRVYSPLQFCFWFFAFNICRLVPCAWLWKRLHVSNWLKKQSKLKTGSVSENFNAADALWELKKWQIKYQQLVLFSSDVTQSNVQSISNRQRPAAPDASVPPPIRRARYYSHLPPLYLPAIVFPTPYSIIIVVVIIIFVVVVSITHQQKGHRFLKNKYATFFSVFVLSSVMKVQ